MSPHPVSPPPGFIRVFSCLETLKSQLESLEEALQLAAQHYHQQPYQQTASYPPGPPPQYGLPPTIEKPPSPPGPEPDALPEISDAITCLCGTLSSATTSDMSLPHQHVHGYRYVRAQSFGGVVRPSAAATLAQIHAAREGIRSATGELNVAIAALTKDANRVTRGTSD